MPATYRRDRIGAQSSVVSASPSAAAASPSADAAERVGGRRPEVPSSKRRTVSYENVEKVV